MRGRSRLLAAPAVLCAAALLAGGCHEEPQPRGGPAAAATPTPGPPPRLTEAERRRLRVAEGRIESHCVAVSRGLVDPDEAPTRAERARAFAAADEMIAVARAKPKALVDVGQDARLYLGDVVENIEGSNCDPAMVDHLERGFARIPAE